MPIQAATSSVDHSSVDHLDDATRARFDEHGVIVHDGVVVALELELARNVVVDRAFVRQDGADANRQTGDEGGTTFARA
ncbi:hypothetical protein BK022_10580 [Methylorubrum extorquens]|uniref:Uncharacterized protein n=1 Tax=Methylorubrum extorquens TaxID=408 RepID=A0A1S1P6I6_METEX|nr:hypothetical protein BK022_10580 [Methylorubrum extorquens]